MMECYACVNFGECVIKLLIDASVGTHVYTCYPSITNNIFASSPSPRLNADPNALLAYGNPLCKISKPRPVLRHARKWWGPTTIQDQGRRAMATTWVCGGRGWGGDERGGGLIMEEG